MEIEVKQEGLWSQDERVPMTSRQSINPDNKSVRPSGFFPPSPLDRAANAMGTETAFKISIQL